MRKAFIRKISELTEQDPSIMLVTGDLGFNFFEEYANRFPQQFLNVGICEQSMAGICAGLALSGYKVFMYSIANFPSLRCLEQIRNDICYHDLPVCIVTNGGGMAYGYLGMSHHGTEDISVMRTLPNMLVSAPADPHEVEGLMDYFYRCKKPTFMRMNRGGEPFLHAGVPSFNGPVFMELCPDKCPKIILVGTGEIGNLLSDIAKKQSMAGLSAQAVLCPIIKPFPSIPEKWLKNSVRLIATIEENNEIGGLGGAFAEALAALPSHPRLLRIGMPDAYCSIVGKQNYLRNYYNLSTDRIIQRIITDIGVFA